MNTVEAYSIEFQALPSQTFVKPQLKFTEKENLIVCEEIRKLLAKKVIEIVDRHHEEYISNIFLRPKKDGTHRIIFNVKELNENIEYHHFKMDTLKSAIHMMKRDCWFGSVDLKDAYYSVLVDQDHRKYLRFLWDGTCYQFRCLPMGLTSSPRVFTKLLKPIFSRLRQYGFNSVIYIDDTLLQGETYSDCESNIEQTIAMLDYLGFTVHPDKSVLKPTQKIEFLGFSMDSVKMSIELLSEKKQELKEACVALSKKRETTVRDFAKVIGKMVAAEPGVTHAPLYIKSLEIEKDRILKLNKGNFDAKFTLSQGVYSVLNWWINNIEQSYKLVYQNEPDITLQSDSSGTGWGAVDLSTHKQTGGHWSYTEQKTHINILELKAAFLALQSFCGAVQDKHIRIQIDNVVAVSYINHMGGRKCELNELTKNMWEWCINRGLWLSAVHLPGSENIQADRLSRKLNDDLEWMLHGELFAKIAQIYKLDNRDTIDMFASRLNYQLPKYVSYLPDPHAIAVDAFSITWNSIVYLFPPFSVIGRVLQKVEKEQCEAVLIAPLWTTQSWFPKLLKLIVDQSFILPRREGTLVMPTDNTRTHPLRKMWLGCFRLSGNNSRVREYRKTLSQQSTLRGEKQQKDSIGLISRDGCLFAIGSKLIHLTHL